MSDDLREVYIHDDGFVMVCPRCNVADEVVALAAEDIEDGKGRDQFGPGGYLEDILGDNPEVVGAFECGDCGNFFTPDRAGKRDVRTFTLSSRGCEISGDKYTFAPWSVARTRPEFGYA
jgi:hypothetical protein